MITLIKLTELRSLLRSVVVLGGQKSTSSRVHQALKDLEQCAVLSWHAFSEQYMGITCPTRKCHSYLQMRVLSFLPPMSTYTHVSGVVLSNMISSSSDSYFEASHKEE